MRQDIFSTVTELLDSRHCVLMGNAVSLEGALYDDSVDNLNALRMLEPSLRELVAICEAEGIQAIALSEIIELIGE